MNPRLKVISPIVSIINSVIFSGRIFYNGYKNFANSSRARESVCVCVCVHLWVCACKSAFHRLGLYNNKSRSRRDQVADE